jgi:hypothetical protein
MSEIEPSETKPENSSKCVDDRTFFERLWCKIDPFGDAYPVWIAILLITLIVLFGVLLRLDFDFIRFSF